MRTNEKRYERERNVVSRRKVQGKKMQRRAFLLSAFCLLLLFSCSYVFTSRAQNSNETVKYYRSIEVAPAILCGISQEIILLWSIRTDTPISTRSRS